MKPASVHARFGRLLFATRASMTAPLGFVIFGFALLGAAVLIFVEYSNVVRFALPLPVAAAGIWMISKAPKEARAGVLVFERGLVAISPLSKGPREVAFDDVESFQYSVVETRVNGLHFSLTRAFKIMLRGAPPVCVQQQVGKSDTSFDKVRHILTVSVARRLRRDYERTGQMRWVKGVTVRRGELLVEGSFAEGVARARRVPLSPDLQYAINDGSCRVFFPGQSDPVLTIQCSEENFYPGFEVVAELTERLRVQA